LNLTHDILVSRFAFNRVKLNHYCKWDLHDTVVQFGEHLDDDTLETAVGASTQSPLSLVLGTSLKVPPASTLPRRSGALVVCNLQW
jgi:NAD-dependent SIR2 family protein deacetylase